MKTLFNLSTVENNMGLAAFVALHVTDGYRVMVGARNCSYSIRDGGQEYYVDGVFQGVDTNSIGPWGTSDFWEYDETGVPTDIYLPVDMTIFIDGYYDVIVITDDKGEVHKEVNMNTFTSSGFEQVSNGWGYVHAMDNHLESWRCIGHKIGTAGTMDTYALCVYIRADDGSGDDDVLLYDEEERFVGLDAYEQICEAYNVR